MTRVRRGDGPLLVALLLACTAGCGSSSPGLEITLSLSDQVLVAADSVRIVITAADGASFPAAPRAALDTGLYVSNVDVDGDGVVDTVVELSRDFELSRENRLSLEPTGLPAARDVSLRAEVFDSLHNRVARLPGDRVPALLQPGETTRRTLAPECVNENCTDATERIAGAQQTLPSAFAVTALVAGHFGEPRRTDLAAGSAAATREVPDPDDASRRVTLPATGRVTVYDGGGAGTAPLHLQAVVLGAQAGDQLGASLAVADLDGDGATELLIGAPGAGGGRGAVYVLSGGSRWPVGACADATLAADCLILPPAFGTQALPAGIAILRGVSVGDHVGVSLAVADQIAAGGLDRVRLFASHPSGLVDAATDLVGPAGSQYGAALTVLGTDLFAVGAPGEAPGGAVYVQAKPGELGTRLGGAGGAFGASLAVADLDADQTAWLVIGAPLDGAGALWMVHLATAAATPTSIAKFPAASLRTLRAPSSVSQLGAAVAVDARPAGDALVVGAPSRLGTPAAGASYVVRGATLQVAPSLSLETDGKPAAATLRLGTAGSASDGFGAQVTVGDVNGDGAVDLVYSGDALPIAGASDLQPGIAVFVGPLL